MTQNDNHDRRRNRRADVELDIDLGAYGTYELRRLENVSIGGAFVRSTQLLDIGTDVKLRFQLPGDLVMIEAEGEVVWTYDQRGPTDHNASGMGIRFTQIKEVDRERIRSFVSQALRIREPLIS